MKVKYITVLILAILVAGLVLVFWYVKTHPAAVKPLAAEETRPAISSLITTAQPTLRTFTLRTPWIGTVEANSSVELTALVAGRIEALMVEDQARIEEGALVTRLSGPQVEGERTKWKAAVASLKNQLELARQMKERLKASLQAQLATKDQVAAAQDALVKLETQLGEAQLDQEVFEEKVRITAPMGGTFTKRRVSVGQEVNAGQVLGDIIDLGHLRIVASLFPPQGVEIQGKEATIRLDEKQFLSGLVRSVLPKASDTGAEIVWIEGPQINAKLRPGQTVGGSVIVEVRSASLAVPESAIIYDAEEHPFLFIQKNGDYEPRGVLLGFVEDGWVEVLSGLEQHQFVVTQGAYELFYRHFNEQFKVPD